MAYFPVLSGTKNMTKKVMSAKKPKGGSLANPQMSLKATFKPKIQAAAKRK